MEAVVKEAAGETITPPGLPLRGEEHGKFVTSDRIQVELRRSMTVEAKEKPMMSLRATHQHRRSESAATSDAFARHHISDSSLALSWSLVMLAATNGSFTSPFLENRSFGPERMPNVVAGIDLRAVRGNGW
jgi:hypothetical protein